MGHCDDHDSLRKDATEAASVARMIAERVDRLTQKVDKLSKQLWLMCGATALLAAIATPGVKLAWDRMIPPASAQEVPIDPGTVDQMIVAAQTGKTSILVGLIMIVCAAIFRNIARGMISERWESLSSALTTVAVVVGGSLAAGAEPLRAALFGVLASSASAGLVDAIRKAIGKKTVLMILIVMVPISSGCGVGPCSIGRTSLDVAISATQPIIEALPDGDNRDAATEYSSGALKIADALVGACDDIEDHEYLSLFGEATKLLTGLAIILREAGVDIPAPILAIVSLIGTGDEPPE